MLQNLKDYFQQLTYKVFNPLIQLFIKLGITPNMITALGFLLNVLSTVVLIYGAEFGERNNHKYIGWAGVILLVGGLMDMLDGRLARLSKQANPFGALFDSVLDRYSELVMFLGFCYYLVSHDYLMSSILAFVAMIGSIMVSYTRARAEGLGVNASVGLMQRPERIVIVAFSAIACGLFSYFVGGDYEVNAGPYPMPIFETISVFSYPIAFLAVSANITAIRRLLHAKSEFEKQANKKIKPREKQKISNPVK